MPFSSHTQTQCEKKVPFWVDLPCFRPVLTYRLGCWCICSCACCRGGWNALQWCSCQLYSAALPRHKNYSNGKCVSPRKLRFISFCNSSQKPRLKYWYLNCWIKHKAFRYCPVWHGVLKPSYASCSLGYAPLHRLGDRCTLGTLRANCPLARQSIHLLDCISCEMPHSVPPWEGKTESRKGKSGLCAGRNYAEKTVQQKTSDRWTTYLLITSQNRVSDI